MFVKYNNLREWLKLVDDINELKTLENANIEEDAGAIGEMLARSNDAPAVIMDNIPGYPKGNRILINNQGTRRRVALTFGFDTDISDSELVEALATKRLNNKIIPAVTVKDGPVMENVLKGDEVDLNLFPSPIWHKEDSKGYIGTGCYLVTRDPDENWVNLGTYRVETQGKNQVGFYVAPGHHGWIHREKYFKKNEPCPVAIVLGGDPLLMVAGCTEVPWGVSEYDWAGGVRGAAYELIIDPITGLPIPAEAEIVLVGFADPEKRQLEGPFGEWTGYYASKSRVEPFIKIEAVYYRNNPIIIGSPPNKPDEADKWRQYTKSAILLNDLKNASVPGVKATWCYAVGGCRLLIAVAIEQRYAGHAMQTALLASQLPAGAYLGRIVVVTDDDIDISNMEELMWAILTRYDPAKDTNILTNCWSGPLDPLIPPEKKAKGEYFNSRLIIDATKPWHWRHEFPKSIIPDKEYRKKTLEKWGFLLNK
ncbi:UbiD family decarboxylase [Candidatus Formimonas warabiya]|uniref:UbiD family decarboxylase n=1 Tax=Formimonas warabiya TaxID=1761012 RepID=A0A3G1KMU0_FORW1|nr:UbiD family decarboxylase [Candidatus Formimonas warabiya]ATW23730.1 hypothetical protein DCMF_02000 [Candidatus Formimonas warabiya]